MPIKQLRSSLASLAASLSLAACATCERHPVACSVAGAAVVAVAAYSIAHAHERRAAHLSGCESYYLGQGYRYAPGSAHGVPRVRLALA